MSRRKTKCKNRQREDYSRLFRHMQNNKKNVSVSVENEVNTDNEQDKALQRILSDENVVYLHQKLENIIHDKHCKVAQSLELKDIEGLKLYDFEAKQCPCCELRAYLCIGAEDYKQYKKYESLFEKMKVNTAFIRKLYIEMSCKTKISAIDTISILHGEEKWKIRSLNGRGRVELLHNDYMLSYYGECTRFNTYHIQSETCSNTTAAYALEVIARHKKHRAYCEYTTEEQQVIRMLRQNPKASLDDMTSTLGISICKIVDVMKSLIASETIVVMDENDLGWKVTM